MVLPLEIVASSTKKRRHFPLLFNQTQNCLWFCRISAREERTNFSLSVKRHFRKSKLSRFVPIVQAYTHLSLSAFVRKKAKKCFCLEEPFEMYSLSCQHNYKHFLTSKLNSFTIDKWPSVEKVKSFCQVLKCKQLQKRTFSTLISFPNLTNTTVMQKKVYCTIDLKKYSLNIFTLFKTKLSAGD